MVANLLAKCKECLLSIAPITLMVLFLHFTLTPLPGGTLALFIGGTILLFVGMVLFTLGVDLAMMPMGQVMGSYLSGSRKLGLIAGVSLVLGVIVTMAEPDLQVLAKQVPSVPDSVLVVSVSAGVGLFLVMAVLRIVFRKRLRTLLVVFYLALFALAALSNPGYLAVAFDSGGVTTGPITVPFILALGVGIASVRGGRSSEDDSFGLCALCSIGPIMAVLIMGMFFDPASSSYAYETASEAGSLAQFFSLFGGGLWTFCKEVALALSPILLFFLLFQVTALRLPRRQLVRMGVGTLYTFFGLVLFLTGANIGFMPTGQYLGAQLASQAHPWLLVPLGFIVGVFVVAAEPAVHVLNKQVETVSGGTIRRRTMLLVLSVGVGISVALSLLRLLTGWPVWVLLAPGYALALLLSFLSPKIFTAIAFDSGGVASGAMTTTFLLPLAMGACEALGGVIMTDAFGIVAMVAMMPLIAIQLLGLVYRRQLRKAEQVALPAADEAAQQEETRIIELTGGSHNEDSPS